MRTKGEEAWNAGVNWEQLDNEDWIRERLDHGFLHMHHFADVMSGIEEDDGDDDGAAIMWLGCMLHEAWVRRRARAQAQAAARKEG